VLDYYRSLLSSCIINDHVYTVPHVETNNFCMKQVGAAGEEEVGLLVAVANHDAPGCQEFL